MQLCENALQEIVPSCDNCEKAHIKTHQNREIKPQKVMRWSTILRTPYLLYETTSHRRKHWQFWMAPRGISKWVFQEVVALTFPKYMYEHTLFTKRNVPFLKYSVLETLGQGQWPQLMLNIGYAPENNMQKVCAYCRKMVQFYCLWAFANCSQQRSQ